MTGRRVVADVGGTRTRFGVSRGAGDLSCVKVYPTAERRSFDDALAVYIDELDAGPPQDWCTGAGIAAAGAIDRGSVTLTNAPWQISTEHVSRILGGVPVRFANDLEAVAMLLPHIAPGDMAPIGPVTDTDFIGNRIAVNIGTGFGAATAVRTRGRDWAIVASEAGHMSLSAAALPQADALRWCQTVEDVLSGAGVAKVYASLAKNASHMQTASDAADTMADAVLARAGSDPIAAATVRLLSRLIGQVTGDIVLSTAAWDGAFLCGSVARAWLRIGDIDIFRAEFERKGSMSSRMARVPTYALLTDEPALLGLSYADL